MKKLYFLLLVALTVNLSNQLNAQINISNSSTLSCSDTLYSSGGAFGNYGNNENFVYVISPPGVDYVDYFVNWFFLTTGDTLFVYDGADTNATLLYMLNDTSLAIPSGISSTGGSMTIQFKSDDTLNDFGFSSEWYGRYTLYFGFTLPNSFILACENDTTTINANIVGGLGSTIQWYYNTTPVGTNSSTYLATITNNLDSVWFSVIDSVCPYYYDSTIADVFNVSPITTASVSVSADDASVCEGTNVTFTATPTNGGASPTYSWTLNGGAVGSNSVNYSNSTLNDNDVVKVTMASDFTGGCLVDSISSDSVVMSIQQIDTASVSFTTSDSTICAGTNVSFTATPVNGGGSPDYSWTVNGGAVGTNSPNFSSSSLTNNAIVKVTLASSISTGCLVDSISTDSVIMAVQSNTTASVSVSADDASVCEGTNVTFTATPTNGGASPDYSWTLNGGAVGSNSTNYSNSTLNDNDIVKVEMASDFGGGCLIDSISSDSVVMNIQQIDTASVSFTTSDNTICAGTNVSFTATPVNGGGSPVYSWTVNGGAVGSNSPNYSSSSLTNNAIVKVTLASSISTGCLVDSISVDSIVMSVQSNTTASVSVASNELNACDGDNVTFTATPVNGGASPDYSWTLNGGAVGSNSPNYSNSTLNDNDEVKVTMASDFGGGCLIDSISSDSIIINVIPNVNASVSVAVSDPSVCAGTNVSFTATPTNGGGSPVYQWKRNGTNVGTNSPNYSNSSITDGDFIWVTMTSSLGGGCLLDSISFDSVLMNINPNPNANVTTSTNVLCNGGSTGTATASGTGGTGTKYYLWDDGATQTTAVATGLVASTYYVVVTDDSSCTDFDSVIITEPTQLTINFVVTDASGFGISDGDIAATASGGVFINNSGTSNDGYDHKWETGLSTGQPRYTTTLSNYSAGWYTDTIWDDNNCKFYDSAFIDQPTLLTGGLINIGGITSKNICDGAIVGTMNQSQATTGGIGGTTLTWQYSYDLLSWKSYPASNSTTYNLNDTITKITFVKRRVKDGTNDTAFSNILFLNYIPDVLINVVGLDAQYCENDDREVLFGSPAGPGTGTFYDRAWINPTTKEFIPDSAVSSAPGSINYVRYDYVDNYGCFSSDSSSTVVYTTTPGSISMAKTIFSNDDSVIVITNTYPGGNFSGLGVYKVGANWYFDPGVIDDSLIPFTQDITFEYTNANGCTSYDTITIFVQQVQAILTTDLGSPSEFYACYFDSVMNIYAVPGSGETITTYYYYYYDEFYNIYYYTGIYYYPNTSSPIVFPFNPKFMTPTNYSTGQGPTPTGVSRYHFYFGYITDVNPYWSYLYRQLEIVHLDDVVIVPNQANSNSMGVPPLQYCIDLDSASFGSSTYPLPGRTTTKSFNVTPSVPLQLVDNGNGTSSFYPPVSGVGNKNMTFTYVDVATGCTRDTTYPLVVDALPVVSLSGLPAANCANDTAVVFGGNPYSLNKGIFTSASSVALNLTHINGNSTASILPSSSNVGNHQVKYTYQAPTGCINSDSVSFVVNPLPDLSLNILSDTSLPLVHCVSDNSTPYVKYKNGVIDAGPNSYINGAGFSPNTSTVFNATSAGVGSHSVIYQSVDANNCFNAISKSITVNPLSNAGFTIAQNPVCDYASDSVLVTANAPGGSVLRWEFHGNTVTGTSSAYFKIGSGTTGNNAIKFVRDDGSTCIDSTSQNLFVQSLPVVTLSGLPASNCANDTAVTITGSPYTLNKGIFSSATSGALNLTHLNGNSTATILPSASNVGSHTVKYSFEAPTGCINSDSVSFVVNPLPVLSLNILSDTSLPLVHCVSDNSTPYVKYKNGVIDAGPNSFINGSGFSPNTSTNFNATSAGVGSHSVIYQSVDANNCFNAISKSITVNPLSNAGFTISQNPVCNYASDSVLVTANAAGGSVLRWEFHGSTVTGSSTAYFKIGSGTTGNNSIKFVRDDGSTCIDSTSQNLFVHPLTSITFTEKDPILCINQGTSTVKVNRPSLGSSYFRSFHKIGSVRVFNSMVDSSIKSIGVDSTVFVPINVNVITNPDKVYVEYIHTDANNCVNSRVDSVLIYNLPTLTVTTADDKKVCALGEVVADLQGFSNGLVPALIGNFYSSSFGTPFNLVQNIDSLTSKGSYGPVPVDTPMTDTIYYEYTDANGCYNRTNITVEIRKLPEPDFSIIASGNPSPKNICLDGTGLVSSYFESCAGCQVYWPNVNKTWYVDTSSTPTPANRLIATKPKEFKPFDDPYKVGGNNYYTQVIRGLGVSPNCVAEYTDTFYVDPYPTPYAYIDSTYITPTGVLCSNDGKMVIKVSPPSPGGGLASVISSPGMYGGFSTTLNALNLDSLVVGRDSLTTSATPPGYKKTYTVVYTYTEPATYCTADTIISFDLKAAPDLSYQTTSLNTVYCPYDKQDSILLKVFNSAALVSSGTNVISGQGISGPISLTGYQKYDPSIFLGDTLTTKDLIKWSHTDADNCTDSVEINGFIVKHQPKLRINIPAQGDSLCLDESPITLDVQYLDTNNFSNWISYGFLTGPGASGDDNYFSFQSDDTTFVQPYAGPQSKIFNPKWDSKFDNDAVVTKIRFEGTYKQTGGCANSDTIEIVTHPKPIARFSLDGSCTKYAPVIHGDISIFDTLNFSPADGISSYWWRINGDSAFALNPGDTLVDYTYISPLSEGKHDFYLTLKSKKGCYSNVLNKEYTFFKSPEADFTWNMDDECKDELVTFKSTSKIAPNSELTWKWDFGDAVTTNDSGLTTHLYTDGIPKVYSVKLVLIDSTGCQDSIYKDFYVRPVISDYPYIDGFNSGYSGWVVWKQDYDELDSIYNPVWFERGLREVGNIQTRPADTAWYLGYDLNEDTVPIYHNLMQTSVISPCFEFTSDTTLTRPMISLQTIYNLEENDGAVLQYTTETGKPLDQVKWENAGDYFVKGNTHYKTGINWYNKENIFGSPGNQSDQQGKKGWTDQSSSDTSWVEARHDIDGVVGQGYVRFRVAFGSNAEAEGEGFIFDDFAIRTREKRVVYETFTNSSQNSYKAIMEFYDNTVKDNVDVLDIQYHTSFPNTDPMNKDNTSDPSARTLFYGLSEVPFLQGDGNKYAEFIASQSFDFFTLKSRALEDPKFVVNMKMDESTNMVETEIVAIADEFIANPVDVTVQVALVEKTINGSEFSSDVASNFQTYNFKNVLKRLYPNAAGTSFNGMTKGDWQGVSTEILYDNFYNTTADYKVIAFVQDKNTKEIYQANWVSANRLNTITGQNDYAGIVPDGVEYTLYPNPTNGTTYMQFDNELSSSYQLSIYNQVGVLVSVETIPSGTQQHSFDISGLTPGMYFVMLNNGTHEVAIKKLMLTK